MPMHTPFDREAPGAISFLIEPWKKNHFDTFFDRWERDGFFRAACRYGQERQLGENPINWM